MTTKQENIQIQTTAFNAFTFGEEITNPEDKKEEVVTEENLTKTTDVMDEVDIIEEEQETTVNSTIVNSTTVNSETTFSASGDTFTTDPPMRTRDRKLCKYSQSELFFNVSSNISIFWNHCLPLNFKV